MLDIEKKENFSRKGKATLLDRTSEKPIHEFNLSSIVPSVRNATELDCVLSNRVNQSFVSGIAIPIVFSDDILNRRANYAKQLNFYGTSADTNFTQIKSKLITVDNMTEFVYYRSGWQYFKNFIGNEAELSNFITIIGESFKDRPKGCDIGLQEKAWDFLTENESARLKYVQKSFLRQSMLNSVYLTCPSNMLHRDLENSLEVSAKLNRFGQIIAKTYDKPYQISLSINETFLRKSKLISQLLKYLMKENMFGTDFDSIAVKLVNDNIHGSSIERRNFSRILDAIVELRGHDKTAMLINADPALAMVSIERGIDVAIVPLNCQTRIKIGEDNRAKGFMAKTGWFNINNLEYLPFNDYLELFEANLKTSFHNCEPCQITEGKDLNRMSSTVFNSIMKEHNNACFAEINKEVNHSFGNDKGGVFVGVRDWIDRSNSKNYLDLLRNSINNPL